MQKFLVGFALMGTILFGSSGANAAPTVWTLSNVAFDHEGFQSSYLNGSFSYDAGTNIFSNVSLAVHLDSACCWNSGVTTATSTASALDFFIVGYGGETAHLNLASLLTDAGGTIKLTSGSLAGAQLRAGQSISAPVMAAVPEPASWALMIGGFALAGAAMRRQRGVMRATFA